MLARLKRLPWETILLVTLAVLAVVSVAGWIWRKPIEEEAKKLFPNWHWLQQLQVAAPSLAAAPQEPQRAHVAGGCPPGCPRIPSHRSSYGSLLDNY